VDLDRAGFEQAIRQFGAELAGGSVGLFYYAATTTPQRRAWACRAGDELPRPGRGQSDHLCRRQDSSLIRRSPTANPPIAGTLKPGQTLASPLSITTDGRTTIYSKHAKRDPTLYEREYQDKKQG
jgi:hypothetical protein